MYAVNGSKKIKTCLTTGKMEKYRNRQRRKVSLVLCNHVGERYPLCFVTQYVGVPLMASLLFVTQYVLMAVIQKYDTTYSF